MKLLTFEQWQKKGYYVRQGERHVHCDADGNCYFSDKQVELKGTSSRYIDEPADYDYDDRFIWDNWMKDY